MLGKSVELTTIGLAAIHPDCAINCANASFCQMFALPSPAQVRGCLLLEHIANHFQARTYSLEKALQNADAALFEFQLEPYTEPLIIHVAKLGRGPRLLVVDRVQKTSVNFVYSRPLSYVDSLTGIGNRLLVEEVIASWEPSQAEFVDMALIMIDLDRFKEVNNTLGHGAGDTLLKLVAKRIASAARSDDPVVRLGGDQFVVLQTIGNQPMGAESVARRIMELLSRPFLVDGEQVNISANIGIALLNHGTTDKRDLIKHAELALHEAKAHGRSTIRFFEPLLAQKLLQRRQFETDLRRALGLKEFTLVYQPQVRMSDGKLIGFEALIRWYNASRGLVSPLDFIAVAEDIGEIHAIGAWVLNTACKALASLEGDFIVAVNVSPVQFEDDHIIDIVREALTQSALPAERLELEITEGVLIKDPESALKRLGAIKALGVGIAMDDFGTGYSSLSSLHSFPFSKIKIDQSFIRGEHRHKSHALVKAIVSLGKNLAMTTLAEGVETEEQYNELVSEGCIEAQGFWISKPLPLPDVSRFMGLCYL